jgi:hypothetical protein
MLNVLSYSYVKSSLELLSIIVLRPNLHTGLSLPCHTMFCYKLFGLRDELVQHLLTPHFFVWFVE